MPNCSHHPYYEHAACGLSLSVNRAQTARSRLNIAIDELGSGPLGKGTKGYQRLCYSCIGQSLLGNVASRRRRRAGRQRGPGQQLARNRVRPTTTIIYRPKRGSDELLSTAGALRRCSSLGLTCGEGSGLAGRGCWGESGQTLPSPGWHCGGAHRTLWRTIRSNAT